MTRAFMNVIRSGVRRRLDAARGEDGWALVIALIVMVVMLGFGAAILAVADTQSQVGAKSRQRDAALQLADAALNAEMFKLGDSWPGSGGANAYPVCTPSSTDTRCPSATMLANLINDPDTASNLSWQINVYDNTANLGGQGQSLQSFFSDSYTSGVPSYDQNGDGKVWVRAQATVGSVTKAVVALVQSQPLTVSLPRAVVVSGSLQTTNNGNKTIIDTQGNSPPPPGTIYVRCNPALNSSCLVYDPSKNQISPDTTSANYTGGSSLNTEIQGALKSEAIANGTYYATCPPTLPSGAVVWIDSGNCLFTGNTTANSSTQPGLMILNSATVNFAGTTTFYGLVYGLNNPTPSVTQTVVQTSGNAQIVGAVFVDGNGGVGAGSSKLNIQFDANALGTISTIASVGYIQSTWREL